MNDEIVNVALSVHRFKYNDAPVCVCTGVGRCIFWNYTVEACRLLETENDVTRSETGEWFAPALPDCPVWNKTTTKLCTCDQLMPGLQAINGRLQLAELHHAGPYTHPPFVFCPWCGERITEEIKMHPDVIAGIVELNKRISGMTKEELEKEFLAAEESQKGEE